MASANRILVKLQPMAALGAVGSRANLRPLHATPQTNAFGLQTDPAWYLAYLPDAIGPNPWDLAHAKVAEQLERYRISGAVCRTRSRAEL
jgi:hypothetical protein